MVQTALQRARNLIFAEVNVDHDREAQRNGACARGDDDIVDRAEGVDEGGNTLFGVGKQPCKIARLHVAEDQRRTDGNGDDVDDCRNVMTQRDDAQLQTHLDACVGALLDHIADQEGHDALGLVVLDDLCASSPFSALPSTTATPGISPVTSGTPSERMMGSGTKPMPGTLAVS